MKVNAFNVIVLMWFWVLMINGFTFLVKVGVSLLQKQLPISNLAFTYFMFIVIVPFGLAYYTLIDLTFKMEWKKT